MIFIDLWPLNFPDPSGWWRGRFRGKEGLFPGNYVEKIWRPSQHPWALTSSTLQSSHKEWRFPPNLPPAPCEGRGTLRRLWTNFASFRPFHKLDKRNRSLLTLKHLIYKMKIYRLWANSVSSKNMVELTYFSTPVTVMCHKREMAMTTSKHQGAVLECKFIRLETVYMNAEKSLFGASALKTYVV